MQRYIGGGIWWRGAPHTAKKRSRRSTCVSWGAPLAPYIKEQGGGGGRPRGGTPRRGNPPPSRFAPPFPIPTRTRGEGGGREKEGEGGRAPPPGCPLSSPLKPIRAQ